MKRKPDGVFIGDTLYLNKTVMMKELKKFGKAMKADYINKRKNHIQELMDYGEDVDVRIEEAFTRACAKKIEETTKFIIKYIKDTGGEVDDGEETKRPSRRSKQASRG